MADSYWDKIDKLIAAAKKNSYLDLENFITNSLASSGFDLSMMNNVYINEIVECPDVFGVYESDGKRFSYVINSYSEKFVREYDNPADFMIAFVSTAPHAKKNENDIKKSLN